MSQISVQIGCGHPYRIERADLAELEQLLERLEAKAQVVGIEWDNKTCEEIVAMVGSIELRCGAPAVMFIKHRNRREGPYFMCRMCGTHNVDNRNAELLAKKPEPTVYCTIVSSTAQ